MKLSDFFEFLVLEGAGRPLSEKKYNFIIQNLGDLIFDSLGYNFDFLQYWDYYDVFKTYLRTKTIHKPNTPKEVAEHLDLIGEWLSFYNDSQLREVLSATFKSFPSVKYKIDNFDKPIRSDMSDTGRPRRGRPPGTGKKQIQAQEPKIISIVSKSKPKTADEYEIIGLDDIEPKPQRERKPTLYLGPDDRLTKRGRKPIDDGLTAIERSKYKSEGKEKIIELENLTKRLDKELDEHITKAIDKMRRIGIDIIKRKKFFGMEISPENEEWFQDAIQKIK